MIQYHTRTRVVCYKSVAHGIVSLKYEGRKLFQAHEFGISTRSVLGSTVEYRVRTGSGLA